MRSPASGLLQVAGVVLGGPLQAGRVARVEAGHGIEQQRAVLGACAIGPAWSRLEAKAIMP
jgi:hypothetical protein